MKQERDFSQVANEALDRLQRGQNIAAILARFPGDARRLSPILETAQVVIRTPRPQPPSGLQASSKARMIQGLNEKKNSFRQHKEDILDNLGTDIQASRGKNLVVAIVALVLIFIILSTISVFALAALPGSPLYSTKLALQDVRVLLTFNPVLRQARITHYYHLRIKDLERAVELQRIQEFEAQATITAMPTPQPIPTWPFLPSKP